VLPGEGGAQAIDRLGARTIGRTAQHSVILLPGRKIDGYDQQALQETLRGIPFPEIARRAKAYQEAHPGVTLHRLGIGNTTEPLPQAVLDGLHAKVDRLGNAET
jgi:hypothetical protein